VAECQREEHPMLWIIILALIAAFMFWVSRKSDSFSLERSTSINAPAADVFGWINNLKRFNQWNPWAQMDPTNVNIYSGPEEGPQASCSWTGKKTGQGSMTLLNQTVPSEVNYALNFVKPFKANNTASFRLSEGNGTTVVVWSMSGTNSFFNKLVQSFFSMDKVVGRDFEKGLASLKQIIEQKKVN
jgi:hypothetical protein